MRLGWRDKLLIANTILFIGTGLVVLARCVEAHAPAIGYAVGAAFLGLGAHRAHRILRALQGQWPPR